MVFVVYCPHAQARWPFCVESDRAEVVAKVRKWVDEELTEALGRSDWLKIDIDIKGQSVKPNVTIRYHQL